MNKITLIRGESLSINIHLDYNKEPVTQFPLSQMLAEARLQNGVRIPLTITRIDDNGNYNLYSGIDTRHIVGDSFRVNVGIRDIHGDAPENLKMLTFDQQFYIVRSATDIEYQQPQPPAAGGHSVVYLVDKEYYMCQSYAAGEVIAPVEAPAKEGYVFSEWEGIPAIMPEDKCVVTYAKYRRIQPPESLGLAYLDLQGTEDQCYVFGIGQCQDVNIVVPREHEGKTVTQIGQAAFYLNQNVRKFYLPDTITEIKPTAFGACSNLTEIVIPETVTRIGTAAFEGCVNLPSIELPANLSALAIQMFNGTTSLTAIDLPTEIREIPTACFMNSGIETIDIPELVTVIGTSSFLGSAIRSIRLPRNLNSIYGDAFRECDSLTDVFFDGTELEWSGVVIWSGNEPLLNANFHFRS